MTDPPDCVKRATQFDLNVCSARDYLRADIELNHVWANVLRRLAVGGDPKRTASLRQTMIDGQRAWLIYREKQCDIWAKWYEGGTIVPLAVNSCSIEITKFRTAELNQLLKDH